MRQLAWLSSRPDAFKGKSRADMLVQFHGDERLAEYEVDPGALRWLVDLWQRTDQIRIEFTMAGSVLLGLRWTDIAAWVEGAGEQDLAPLFREGIKALSAAYAETSMAARDVGCEAPFDPAKG